MRCVRVGYIKSIIHAVASDNKEETQKRKPDKKNKKNKNRNKSKNKKCSVYDKRKATETKDR